MNDGRPLRQADPERLIALFREQLSAAYGAWERSEGTGHDRVSWLRILSEATQAEATSVEEMVRLAGFTFVERVTPLSSEARDALADPSAPEVFRYLLETLTPEALTTPDSTNAYLREVRHHFRDTRGLRGKRVMFPIRAALVGAMEGPCLGIVVSLLGAARCRERLEDAMARA